MHHPVCVHVGRSGVGMVSIEVFFGIWGGSGKLLKPGIPRRHAVFSLLIHRQAILQSIIHGMQALEIFHALLPAKMLERCPPKFGICDLVSGVHRNT